MARKITFEDFRQLLNKGYMSRDFLGEYLEQDPNASIPRLRFKTEALLDEAPTTYDVDLEVYNMMRRADTQRKKERVEIFGLSENPDVVAEGDSWFRHFPLLKPTAIASWIAKNKDIDIDNIAKWSDTLFEILQRKEYRSVINANDTEIFMLSAGGNDLQGGISRYVHDCDAGRPIDNYVTDEGLEELERIRHGYQTILREVTDLSPSIKILCYGYDYPRPSNGSKYIGRYLEQKTYSRTANENNHL